MTVRNPDESTRVITLSSLYDKSRPIPTLRPLPVCAIPFTPPKSIISLTDTHSRSAMGSVSWESVLPNALGSAGAGMLSRALTHPLDTVKARLQVDATSSIYKGPFSALRQIWATEGLAGWYRGFSTVIVGGTPGTILYLCTYDMFKHRIALAQGSSDSNEGLIVHFSSGLLAEAVACIVYVPVDVIKERLQVQKFHSTGGASPASDLIQPQYYKNGTDALFKILRQEGWYGIYRGYGATLASFGPFSALYFVFYERFKSFSKDFANTEILSLPYLISSSALAGALASFLTSPLDLAKLRLQVQRAHGPSTVELYRGVVDTLRHVYRQAGIVGLFRGAGTRVMHFVPATTLTMTAYESMREFFHGQLFGP